MSAVVSLPVLFDRSMRSDHAWYASYQAMQKSSLETVQAVHANLAMEHRIGSASITNVEAGVAQWLQSQSAIGVPPDLNSALRSYFAERYIQPPRDVRFLGDPVEKLPAKTPFIHTTSLSKLFKRLLQTEISAGKLFSVFETYLSTTRDLPDAGKKWDASHTLAVANRLSSLDRPSFDELMEAVHQLLPANSPCWWAAPYLDLKKQTQQLEMTENIALALGMGYFEADDFLLVYQYTAAQAGQLYTPTTPETDAYAYHFPNPPKTNAHGGLSMPLADNLKPCSEFIHHPLSAEHASRALLQPIRSLQNIIEMSELAQKLSKLRDRHRQVLCAHHCPSPTGYDWVQEYEHLM
jgi:hypothetical protein